MIEVNKGYILYHLSWMLQLFLLSFIVYIALNFTLGKKRKENKEKMLKVAFVLLTAKFILSPNWFSLLGLFILTPFTFFFLPSDLPLTKKDYNQYLFSLPEVIDREKEKITQNGKFKDKIKTIFKIIQKYIHQIYEELIEVFQETIWVNYFEKHIKRFSIFSILIGVGYFLTNWITSFKIDIEKLKVGSYFELSHILLAIIFSWLVIKIVMIIYSKSYNLFKWNNKMIYEKERIINYIKNINNTANNQKPFIDIKKEFKINEKGKIKEGIVISVLFWNEFKMVNVFYNLKNKTIEIENLYSVSGEELVFLYNTSSNKTEKANFEDLDDRKQEKIKRKLRQRMIKLEWEEIPL